MVCGEIERYFSRKKRVFRLGEERTRHLKNFRANCYLTSIMEILEWATTPQIWMYYLADSIGLDKKTHIPHNQRVLSHQSACG